MKQKWHNQMITNNQAHHLHKYEEHHEDNFELLHLYQKLEFIVIQFVNLKPFWINFQRIVNITYFIRRNNNISQLY